MSSDDSEDARSSVEESDHSEHEEDDAKPLGQRLEERKDASRAPRPDKSMGDKNKKRSSKHAPMEVSAKKPVSRFYPVMEVARKRARDPRFDDLSGDLNEGAFHRAYAFLDEMEDKELKTMKSQLVRAKGARRREDLTQEIRRVESRRQTREIKRDKGERLTQHIKGEREKVSQGKKPFFLKKSELRKMELVDKFNTLKESGQLDKFVAKRRRKVSAKEHKRVPRNRDGPE